MSTAIQGYFAKPVPTNKWAALLLINALHSNFAAAAENQILQTDEELIETESDAGDVNAEDPLGGLPDLEFLEFLGSWETDEGEWLDPNQFVETGIAELIDAQTTKPSIQESTSQDSKN